MPDVKEKIRRYVIDNFMFADEDASLDDDVSFLEMDIIDSTGVIELVGFVEDTFKIEVDDSEITRENFDSVSCLDSFVQSKRSAG